MNDPYEVLGLEHSADTDSIRRRYLELVRCHSPEREPERFAEVRAAYDALRDPIVSLKKRLFDLRTAHTFDSLMEHVRPDIRSPRIPTETLLAIGKL
ncbi:MAG: J domain-containing protein [Patescibacteria group bacterium]|nr:J domain-containing protein [Patescibacteria group bacterium]